MPRIPDHVHGGSNEQSAQGARSLIGRTNNDAQAGSGSTIANRPKQFFYCPLCSCIALIDRTTTTYYVWVTAFVFKAPCSESLSFFSFLALFSFFHVTAAPHSFPCDPVPRARALCIGGNICSHQKRRMPCFFPFRRPGPRFPNSPQSERGKYARRLASRKPGKAREGKENEMTALRVRKRKRASHAVGGGGGQEAQRRQFSWTLLLTSLCALSPPGG